MTTLRCILAVFTLFFVFSVKKFLIDFLGDIQISLAYSKLDVRLYEAVEVAATAFKESKFSGDRL